MLELSPAVGIGHCNIDYLGVVERYPPVDRKEQLSTFSIQGGGPVPTALATLAAFGVPCRLVGKVADDEFGRRIAEGLQSRGIDTEHLIMEPGAVSPFSFIAVERTSGKRNIFWTSGSISPLAPAEVDPGVVDGASAVLLDGHRAELQLELARRARSQGVPVMLDASSLKPGMLELLPEVDYLVASERFAAEAAPSGELAETLGTLRDLGPRVVVVTLGEDGCAGFDGGAVLREPAIEVDAVDTTGAGDVFHGAFLYGVLQQWPLARSLRFANGTAGLKCRALGGMAGIPSLGEVLDRIGPS